MPHQLKFGQYNQLTWFLHEMEIQWLRDNLHQFPNRELLKQFNIEFQCNVSYARLRHFMAQYGIKRCERGEKYTDAEREYVTAHYESDPDCWMGKALGRTEKSILKLRQVLGLKRSDASVARLRYFRSQSGARTLHRRIETGECVNPAVALTDGFICSSLRRGTGLANSDIPGELIALSRTKILLDRQIKKISNG